MRVRAMEYLRRAAYSADDAWFALREEKPLVALQEIDDALEELTVARGLVLAAMG